MVRWCTKRSQLKLHLVHVNISTDFVIDHFKWFAWNIWVCRYVHTNFTIHTTQCKINISILHPLLIFNVSRFKNNSVYRKGTMHPQLCQTVYNTQRGSSREIPTLCARAPTCFRTNPWLSQSENGQKGSNNGVPVYNAFYLNSKTMFWNFRNKGMLHIHVYTTPPWIYWLMTSEVCAVHMTWKSLLQLDSIECTQPPPPINSCLHLSYNLPGRKFCFLIGGEFPP